MIALSTLGGRSVIRLGGSLALPTPGSGTRRYGSAGASPSRGRARVRGDTRQVAEAGDLPYVMSDVQAQAVLLTGGPCIR